MKSNNKLVLRCIYNSTNNITTIFNQMYKHKSIMIYLLNYLELLIRK